MEAEAEDSAQWRGHNVAVAARGVRAPVISCCSLLFQLNLENLKKGLPLITGSPKTVSILLLVFFFFFFSVETLVGLSVVCWLHEFSWHCCLIPPQLLSDLLLVVPVLTAHAISAWAEECSCPLPFPVCLTEVHDELLKLPELYYTIKMYLFFSF